MIEKDIIIIGGGAAGYFAAINIAEQVPHLQIAILEKNKKGLHKVKISGGGRCNVTHAEFVPSELVQNYPRGRKELLGPFHQFMTGDTIQWFSNRGVELKIEEDGRMFPVTDSSQTIIDCFLSEVSRLGIQVYNTYVVKDILKENDKWKLDTNNGNFLAEKIVVATGSSPKVWDILQSLGHQIIEPLPSLFTFHVNDKRLKDIPGVSVQNVEIGIVDSSLQSSGPLMVTHEGLSGPAILKLSAFGAIELARLQYNFQIQINFIGLSFSNCLDELKNIKHAEAKKTIYKYRMFELPKRLWQQLVVAGQINEQETWADINKTQLENLARQLTEAGFQVTGKSTYKEEFVTAGGVDLKEVNFKTFESKIHKSLYFAGEVLNIDAVTGGFNFQNAWTGAYIVAQNMV